jgi:hypothetical protein
MRRLRDAWRVLRGTHVAVHIGHAAEINGELGMERFRLAHLPPDGTYAATLPNDIVLPKRWGSTAVKDSRFDPRSVWRRRGLGSRRGLNAESAPLPGSDPEVAGSSRG